MKKKMKKGMLIVVLCLLLTGISTADTNIVDSMDFQGEAVTLSLEDATQIMMKDNPTLQENALDVESAQVDAAQYKKAINKSEKIYENKQREDSKYIEYIKIQALTRDYILANVQRNQEAVTEKLKADVENAYFGLLQAEKSLEIYKADLKVANDLFEQTKKKFELGLVAKQEVLNSELSMIKAQSQLQSAENTLKTSKMSFNTTLGNNVMTEIKLTDELSYTPFEEISIADAISKALIDRNEIKSKEYNYEKAELTLEMYDKKYSEIMYEHKVQKVNVEKAKQDLENTKRSVEVEVRSNYLDIIAKQQEIIAGQKSVELSEEALRMSQLSYEAGLSVLSDVQSAQSTLQQAKLGLLKATLDYNLAVLTFEDSMGVGRTSMPFSAPSAKVLEEE